MTRINRRNYNDRGNSNLGIVVRLQTLVGDRLVYFDYNRKTKGWVIRDFIGEWKLENEHSKLSIGDIEADADMDEFPPWLNVEHEKEWRDYLRHRTNAVMSLRTHPISMEDPDPAAGKWLKMS